MELEKESTIKILRKICNRCPTCGEFFIGASIEASTEDGNYGIDFEAISNYYIKCGKCPDCATTCYENLAEYVNLNGRLPCNDEEIDDIEYFLKYYKRDELIECYLYTYDFQCNKMKSGNPIIKAGNLVDLLDVILGKLGCISIKELNDLPE